MASSGWGGAEKAFVELSNELASRCELSVLVPPDAEYTDRFSGAIRSVRSLRSGSRRNPLVLSHLRGVIREVRPDIVHTHAAKATEMMFWVGKVGDVNHVATKHNARDRMIFGRIRWVTAVSEQAAYTIHNRSGVTIVPNGIHARPVGPQPRADTFTMLAVGRLDRYKGFDVLIREVATLPFDFVLEIAGEGPERSRLESLIVDLGVEANVHLLGHRDDVPELLARVHLQVVSSRTEGFSLALLEGLHYSGLIVSTPVGIAPEVLPAELLIEDLSIARKITDVKERYDELAVRFAGSKAEHIGRFLWSRAAQRYLELYRRVLAER